MNWNLKCVKILRILTKGEANMKFKIGLIVVLVCLVSALNSKASGFSWGIENPGPPNVIVLVGGTEREVAVSTEMNCWTTKINGRIGNFSGRVVLKFKTPQKIKMIYAECENSSEISAESRAFWASRYYRNQYYWKILGRNQTVQNPTPTVISNSSLGYDTLQFFDGPGNNYSLPKGIYCVTEIYGDSIVAGDTSKFIFKTVSEIPSIELDGVFCFDFYEANRHITEVQARLLVFHYYGFGNYSRLKIRYLGRKGNIVTPTRTPTKTITPTIGSSISIPAQVTAMFKPRIGDICWGQEVGQYRNHIVEFTKNVNYSIYIKNGGCITHGNYSSWQVLQYLKSTGLNYKLIEVPLIPTITPTPTVTIVPKLVHDWASGKASYLVPIKGTICWGDQVAGKKLFVVEFKKNLQYAILIQNGFCAHTDRYTAADIFNHLIRNGKRLTGIYEFN